jgi:hypothetical protein
MATSIQRIDGERLVKIITAIADLGRAELTVIVIP